MFELHITCSKDIDELHINFSDGTVVTSNNPTDKKRNKDEKSNKGTDSEKPKSRSTAPARKEQVLDTDVDFGGVSQEVVEKPVIGGDERPVKIAEELQNFDF